MSNTLALLRAFCAAAESGSFREAAARLAVSPQAITRAVKELERHYGEPLFHRNTRQVRITEFGAALAGRARAGLDGIDLVLRPPAAVAEGEIAGRVRVTAPRGLGRRIVPAVAALGRAHPGLDFDLRLSNELADVVDTQIDVGVRIGFFRDNQFVVRRAGRVGFAVVASPALLARTGPPADAAALDDLPTTALLDRSTNRPWPWYFAGERQWSAARNRLVTDDPDAECDAVLAGVGYGQLPDFMAARHLRAGRLVEVLAADAPSPWEVYVYRPQRGPVPARVRLAFEAIIGAVAAPPAGGGAIGESPARGEPPQEPSP